MMPHPKSQDGQRKRISWNDFAPNVVQSLIPLSVISLLLAIFVFGEHGKYTNLNLADILRTLGISALAAVVTAILDRRQLTREIVNRIDESVREGAGITKSLKACGILKSHSSFDFRVIFREAKAGETLSWLDTYCPCQNEFVEELKAALRRRVRVRMMIIDPQSRTAHLRDQELEGTVDSGGGWTAGLAAFIAKMQTVEASKAGEFEIRLYDDLPCAPMYLIGKPPDVRKGFFSLFLVRPSAQCQHVELGKGEWLDDMAGYFEKKWDRHSRNSSQQAVLSPLKRDPVGPAPGSAGQ